MSQIFYSTILVLLYQILYFHCLRFKFIQNIASKTQKLFIILLIMQGII